MAFVHYTVKKIVHGLGAIKEAANEVKNLKGSKAFIVTDPGLAKIGVQKPLEEALTAGGIEWKLYAEAQLEPSMDSIQHCTDEAKAFGADVIIGFGGGSALDTTKAASVLLSNEGPIDKSFGINLVPNPSLPCILIPTTSGTGSEMTNISVLADTKNGGKKGVVSEYMYADTVILDAELTFGLPPRVTAMTGVDAFVHAMESFCGIAATPITDALSANFNRSFLLALPPIVLVALAIRGIPPLPTLVIAILVGVVCAFVIQDGMTVKGMFKAATDGYVSQTGHPLVDKILSRGGLTSMSFVVFLLLIAMTLGGILEGTGALGVVVDRMTRSVTSPGGLILATLVSCYLMTIGTGNGMLSIIVPARAFEKKFRDMGIQSRVLSRPLEDAVTLGIALVPYSMAAFFIVGVLKIDAMQYIPYAFVNWIVPIFSLTYGFTGFAIWKINKDAGNSPAESEA